MLFEAKEFENLKEHLAYYRAAQRVMLSKLETINEDYNNFSPVNPIDHIKSRIKTPESIAQKLSSRELPVTAEAAWEHLTDISGIRIICSYSVDIYEIAERLKQESDLTLIRESDYVSNPKESGYRSFHMIFEVPVYMNSKLRPTSAEVQIRTAAMDFWASLEHKVKYKYDGQMPKHLSDELKLCAEKTNEIDKRMYLIHDILKLINL